MRRTGRTRTSTRTNRRRKRTPRTTIKKITSEEKKVSRDVRSSPFLWKDCLLSGSILHERQEVIRDDGGEQSRMIK